MLDAAGGRHDRRDVAASVLRAGAHIAERGRAGIGEAVEEVLHGRREAPAVPTAHQRTAVPPVAPPAPPSRPTASAPIGVKATAVTAESIVRDGFTATTPFHPEPADVLVICCSSEKFELQHQELIAALGYNMPHFIQVPGGPASLYGLAAIKGFMAKAMGMFVDKAIELIGVKHVILIAHEECGAYKSGRNMVISELTQRLAGKGTKEAQLEHLRKASREVQSRLGRGITVTTYYGNIVEEGGHRLIHFEPIATD